MTTELVFAAIFMGPILLGGAVWILAVLNWPGFGRLGCRLGRHQLPARLEPYEHYVGIIFVGRCPRCNALITRTTDGEWIEV